MSIILDMGTVYVVHGCPSRAEGEQTPEERTYDKHWMPWLKKELTTRGIDVEMPLMPEPWAPDYEGFKKEFEKQSVSEDSVLVGHSCGCAFLVRWLGESKQKVKRLILVAPWKVYKDGDALNTVTAADYFSDGDVAHPKKKRYWKFTSHGNDSQRNQKNFCFHWHVFIFNGCRRWSDHWGDY